MNEKILQIYEKCMKHNITVTINTMLSHNVIKITGECLAYNRKTKEYDHLRYNKLISIDEIRDCNIDILECNINELFYQLLEKRKEIEQ